MRKRTRKKKTKKKKKSRKKKRKKSRKRKSKRSNKNKNRNQEQQQDTPEPDPPSSDQSASIPSLPDNTQETNLLDYFEEALALTEMEAFDNIIQDTPNLLEELPAILRSRTPDTSEVIVGDYETNDPTPPIVIDESLRLLRKQAKASKSQTHRYHHWQAFGIPEPGVFGLFIVAAWFCTGWSFRRRRDKR